MIAHYEISLQTTEFQAGETIWRQKAQALAIEQSLEMPLSGVSDVYIRNTLAGQVLSVEPLNTANTIAVQLSLSAQTIAGDCDQLMNMLFGNCSLRDDVSLIDVQLPDSLSSQFKGPAHGVNGLREQLGISDGRRVLTCSALKPQGLDTQKLALLASRFADAGIDIIKDDHGITDQIFAPFSVRVPAVQAAIEQSNRRPGRNNKTIYAPRISGGPDKIRRQIDIAHECGVGALLVCPMLTGLPVFTDLIRPLANVPIIAHPAFAGATRIAPPLLLGKLFRLFGADATIFPNAGGRFGYSIACCQAIADAARAPWHELPACLPVPAGGMTIDKVTPMIEQFGDDLMLLIGGNLLENPAQIEERARRFVERVHTVSAARH